MTRWLDLRFGDGLKPHALRSFQADDGTGRPLQFEFGFDHSAGAAHDVFGRDVKSCLPAVVMHGVS
jgi:hypothetical protein